jgi:hypothetical protein
MEASCLLECGSLLAFLWPKPRALSPARGVVEKLKCWLLAGRNVRRRWNARSARVLAVDSEPSRLNFHSFSRGVKKLKCFGTYPPVRLLITEFFLTLG